MTTTAAVDNVKRTITVVTDNSLGAGTVQVGADNIPFTYVKNAIVVTGPANAVVSNDGKAPTTTAVFSF